MHLMEFNRAYFKLVIKIYEIVSECIMIEIINVIKLFS